MIAIFMGMLDTDEEKDKLTQIYEKYYGTMLAVAKSIIADYSLAEDAVSNAILTVIKNLHKINDVSSHKAKAYIVIIVRSSAIDLLRKQKITVKNLLIILSCPIPASLWRTFLP